MEMGRGDVAPPLRAGSRRTAGLWRALAQGEAAGVVPWETRLGNT